MNKSDWIKNTDDSAEEKEIIIWKYAGRSGGWWSYQESHANQIEIGYLAFLNVVEADEVTQEDETEAEKEKNDENDHENEEKCEFDDSSKGNNEIVIEIGMKEYVIDFVQMIQYDAEYPMKRRKIKREIKTKSTLQRSDSLKGCAGKFFSKSEANVTKE